EEYLSAFPDIEVLKTSQDQNINSYDLFKYRAVFMINGVEDDNDALPNFQSVNRLATYIAAGGRVYCEGADFGYDYGSVMAPDQRRRLFNLFGAVFAEDGYPASSGNVMNIRGEDTSFFRTGAVNLDYHWESIADHRVDEWADDTITEGTSWAMFSQDSPPPLESTLRMVYREQFNYRTVLSSVYIGSMIDGNAPSTRMHVLTAIVNFLLGTDFNPPPTPLVEEKRTELPAELSINASPNPFNASCKLTVDIDTPGIMSLDIYDINGRHVANLAEEHVSAGKYSVVWEGFDNESRELPSGVYFAVLKSAGRQTQSRLVLIK
ncbi:MAG: T9SS type A sorting domain-containing protein, partial [bacterium]